jgi:hypothetical protein
MSLGSAFRVGLTEMIWFSLGLLTGITGTIASRRYFRFDNPRSFWARRLLLGVLGF